MATLGTVEIGGTKTLAAVGSTLDDINNPWRIDTGDPESTLDAVCEYLGSAGVSAVGIASFGPVELRRDHRQYGNITNTPKPGWSFTDVVGFVSQRLAVPVGFDTDVNGSALGEGRWGAAMGLSQFVYITVGTGIGGGAVVDGAALHGLVHPEMGHLAIRRLDEDDFPGLCPFHGACMEGMASGPSLEARFGVPGRELHGTQLAVAMNIVTSYLAQGLTAVTRILAPQRIIVGGGVAKLPGFHEILNEAVTSELANYPGLAEHREPGFVSPPDLGDRSGLAGGLVLAQQVSSGQVEAVDG